MSVLRVLVLVWVIVMGVHKVCFADTGTLVLTSNDSYQSGIQSDSTYQSYFGDNRYSSWTPVGFFATVKGVGTFRSIKVMPKNMIQDGYFEYVFDKIAGVLDDKFNVIARFKDSNNYLGVKYDDSANTLQLFKVIAGTKTYYTADTGTTSVSLTEPFRIGIKLNGTSLTAYADGVEKSTSTADSAQVHTGLFGLEVTLDDFNDEYYVGITYTEADYGSLAVALYGSTVGVKITGDLGTGWKAGIYTTAGTLVGSLATESGGIIVIPYYGIYGHGRVKLWDSSGEAGTLQADTSSMAYIKSGLTFDFRSSEDIVFCCEVGVPYESTTYSNQKSIRIRGRVRSGTYSAGNVTVSCVPSCTTNSAISVNAYNYPHADNDYMFGILIDNLDENTSYAVTIQVNATSQTDGSVSFNSGPLDGVSGNYKICFSACLLSFMAPYSIFDTMYNDSCTYYVSMGDTPYVDRSYNPSFPQSWDGIIQVYRAYDSDPDKKQALSAIPTSRTLNDHEYCDNYFDGAESDAGYSSCYGLVKADAQNAYDAYQDVVNSPSNSSPNYGRSFIYGDIYNILPDMSTKANDYRLTDSAYYYGQNLTEKITNGGMENCTSAEPDNWSSSNTTYTGCSTASIYSGTNGVQVAGVATANYVVQNFSTVSGATYTASVWMKTAASGGDIPIFNIGTTSCGTEKYTVSNNSTTWTQYTYEWVAPSSETVWVCLKANDDGSNVAYFDDVTVTEVTPEVQPSCTRDGSDLSRLNCTSVDFSTENPAITSAAMVKYDGRWYQVSSVVDADTLDLASDISCTSCTNQTTQIIKSIKSHYGSSEFVWFLNSLTDADTNADVNYIFIWSSSPLTGNRYDFRSGDYDMWAYQNERNVILSHINGLSNTVRIFSGDDHVCQVTKETAYNTIEFTCSDQGHSGWSLEDESHFPNTSFYARMGSYLSYGKITLDPSNSKIYYEKRDLSGGSTFKVTDSSGTLTTDWGDPKSGKIYGPYPMMNTTNNLQWKKYYNTDQQNQGKIIIDDLGYCWAGFMDNTSSVILKRSDDTSCLLWGTYNYTSITGEAPLEDAPTDLIHYTYSGTEKLHFSYSTSSTDMTIQECTISGTPRTISGCSAYTLNSGATNKRQHIIADTSTNYFFDTHINFSTNDRVIVKRSTNVATSSAGYGNAMALIESGVNVLWGTTAHIGGGNLLTIYATSSLLRYAKCTAGGDNLCTPLTEYGTATTIASSGFLAGADTMKIATDGSGNALIAFTGDDMNVIKFSYYNGTSFSSVATAFNESGLYDFNKPQAVWFQGTWYIFWFALSDSSIQAIRSKVSNPSSSADWEKVTFPVLDKYGKHRPNVFIVDSNTVGITYQSVPNTRNSANIINTSGFGGWMDNMEGMTKVIFLDYTGGIFRERLMNPHINKGVNSYVN